MKEADGLITPEEAAQYIRVDVRTIYRWLKDGTLPGAKIGDNWRIRKSDIDAFFKSSKERYSSG